MTTMTGGMPGKFLEMFQAKNATVGLRRYPKDLPASPRGVKYKIGHGRKSIPTCDARDKTCQMT